MEPTRDGAPEGGEETLAQPDFRLLFYVRTRTDCSKSTETVKAPGPFSMVWNETPSARRAA